MEPRKKILLIHGPNLNLLGKRSPDIYGNLNLNEINNRILSYAREKEIEVDIYQTNSEAEIIEMIHNAENYNGIVINPGAYTHTSIAIRDAIEAMGIKAVEVHISNIYAREPFRRRSVIAPVCAGQISGCGWFGYILALKYFLQIE